MREAALFLISEASVGFEPTMVDLQSWKHFQTGFSQGAISEFVGVFKTPLNRKTQKLQRSADTLLTVVLPCPASIERSNQFDLLLLPKGS